MVLKKQRRARMLEKLLRLLDKQKPVRRIFTWIILLISSLITLPVIIFFYVLINQSFIPISFSLVILCGWSLFLFILIHELGHLYVAKLCGVPTQGIIFLPLFGAAAIINKEKLTNPISRWKDLLFSAGGSIASLITILIISFLIPTIPLWLKIAIFFWAFISLFNLLPVYPYDGGRMFLDLIAGLKKSIFISRLIGLLTMIALSIGIFLYAGFHWTVILTIGLLWLYYLFLLKTGKIAEEDKTGQPMNVIKLVLGIIIYLGLIAGFLYVFIRLIRGF
jgi:Zn-dependent protease